MQSVIVVLGLVLFEVISSIDNAIVNAHVLKTIPPKYRRYFLIWGLLLAVVVMRGILPFVIVWLANLDLGLVKTAQLAFTDPVAMEESLHHSKPLLLVGGGVYLVMVFLAWFFVEEKKYAFFVERMAHKLSVWFYAVSSLVITLVIWWCLSHENPHMALAASIGSTVFFLGDGFRRNAEEAEVQLQGPSLSAWSKLLYLEVLDASFSIDGVVGAFAFTMSVPLILVGNGIGAFVVREFTVRGLDVVARFAYLKNGAMYSIGVLGVIMLVESFGTEPPFWVAPLTTVVLLFVFLGMSVRELWVNKVLMTRVLVLQHPQEKDHTLGTVPLLESGVGAVRRVGLSWRNLAAAWGADPEGRWAVVWPLQLPAELPPGGPVLHLDRTGTPTDAALAGLVALDGSWSQAKALWWRNPWLLKLDRIVVRPSEPSIYGRLRREPRAGFVSTLEAVADALVAAGEPAEVRTSLRRAMRTMVQRARDAGAAGSTVEG